MPNAQVELAGGSLPRALTATTNTNGIYQFMQVPAATGYTVSITAQGFRTAKIADIAVQLGRASTADARLEVGQVTESVVVSGTALTVDTQTSSSAINVDRAFFEELPKGRSFYDLINIAPGARNEGKAGGYEIDGASGSENTFFLDGMDVTAVQTGTLSGQNRIPTEMVQQVEVKNGVMEAQYGGAMGGVVNAVVRSGTNAFHGQVGAYFNNGAMQARPRPSLILDPNNDDLIQYVQNNVDDYNTWQPIFSLGGPLVKNRLFFFSSYEPIITRGNRTVTFTGGTTNTFKQRSAQQFLSNKVDFQPWSKLRMNMAWIWNPQRTTGSLPGYAGTDDPNNPWGQLGSRTAGNILHGQIDYIATSKLILSFRGGYNYTNFGNNYGIPLQTAIYYSNSNRTIAGIPSNLLGSAGWQVQANGVTLFDKYTRKNFAADLSYVGTWHGQHDLKGGWQRNDLSNDVNNNTYPGGYYRFYWGLNGASSGTYTCAVSCTGKLSGQYGYYRYRILGTLGAATSNNQALFLQDNWRVNRRLTLNLGLRTEREFVPSFTSNGSTPSPAIKFDFSQKLSPRIGAAFDLTGSGKQKIYASWGIFYDIMKYEMPRGSFGGDVWKDFFFALDDPNLVTTLGAKGFVNATSPADASKFPGKFFEMIDWRIPSNDPSQNLIDPNLKPMKQKMFDFGYEQMITPTLVGSVRFTDRRLVRTIEDTGIETPEGEQYFIANPGEGITTGANWTKLWGPGIPEPPKPVRHYDAMELRLDKRFAANYQFAFSYTLSRLYGNYSGLASSDENGRTSPNVNRYYDQPWVGLTQGGNYPYGLLATDRPHTFKLFGSYSLRSKLGRTTFAPTIQAYSGTPITTEALIYTGDPSFPFGRGDMGRTPFFFNTDFQIQHDFMPFHGHEQMKLRLEGTVFNLFNSATPTDYFKTITHQNDVGSTGLTFSSAAAVFKGWDTRALMAAQEIRVDPEYGRPTAFQGPRSLRVQLSFFF